MDIGGFLLFLLLISLPFAALVFAVALVKWLWERV